MRLSTHEVNHRISLDKDLATMKVPVEDPVDKGQQGRIEGMVERETSVSMRNIQGDKREVFVDQERR